jgi:hypothetical protein
MSEKLYVIVGTKKDGSQNFLGIDNTSGGYPYWASGLYSAKLYREVPDVMKERYGTGLYSEVSDLKVCQIILEPVETGIDYMDIITKELVEKRRKEVERHRIDLKSQIEELQRKLDSLR